MLRCLHDQLQLKERLLTKLALFSSLHLYLHLRMQFPRLEDQTFRRVCTSCASVGMES